jgi:hypothetical protein
MSRNGIRSGLADPSRLEPIVDDDDDEIIEVGLKLQKAAGINTLSTQRSERSR